MCGFAGKLTFSWAAGAGNGVFFHAKKGGNGRKNAVLRCFSWVSSQMKMIGWEGNGHFGLRMSEWGGNGNFLIRKLNTPDLGLQSGLASWYASHRKTVIPSVYIPPIPAKNARMDGAPKLLRPVRTSDALH